MAFMNYDQYIQTFGEQLAKASQPTPIIPQSEGAFAPMESGNQAPPPASPPPAAPAEGAFGGAPVAAAGPEVPAAPAGPMSQAMPQSEGAFAPMESGNQAPPPASPPPAAPAEGAFGGAPVAAAGPEVPAAPAGPMSQAMPPSGPTSPAMPPSGPMSQAPGAAPSGAFTPAKEEAGPTGLSMHKLFEDSSEEEREQFATDMEAQVPDVIAAANAAAEQDPEGASKWDSFLSKRGWNRQEASAWLMEFGLRMMQAGGSGEGNFLSDVGGSALGATEARRAFKTKQEEDAIRDEDRAHELETRERDKKKWGAEDREETRERKRKSADEMRKQEAHEMNKKLTELNLKGAPRATVNEDNEVVFSYPGSQQNWNTGIKAGERDSANRTSAFAEQLNVWQHYRAGGAERWKTLTDAEQQDINGEFFAYQKSGVNKEQYRQQLINRLMIEENKKRPGARQSEADIVASVDRLFPPDEPTEAGGVTPGWAD